MTRIACWFLISRAGSTGFSVFEFDRSKQIALTDAGRTSLKRQEGGMDRGVANLPASESMSHCDAIKSFRGDRVAGRHMHVPKLPALTRVGKMKLHNHVHSAAER